MEYDSIFALAPPFDVPKFQCSLVRDLWKSYIAFHFLSFFAAAVYIYISPYCLNECKSMLL